MRKFLVPFLLFATACNVAREDASTATATVQRPSPSARQAAGQPAADSCLAQNEWSLGSVTLNAPTRQTLGKLGAAIQTLHDSSEDDGGIYQLTTYRYKDLEFDDVRDEVDRVSTASPSVATPWGVKPGITRDSVARLLARYGIHFTNTADTLDVGDCGAPSAYLTVAFTQSGIVKSVQIAAERP